MRSSCSTCTYATSRRSAYFDCAAIPDPEPDPNPNSKLNPGQARVEVTRLERTHIFAWLKVSLSLSLSLSPTLTPTLLPPL